MSEIEQIKQELQSLQERLLKLEQADKQTWKPSKGEKYWVVSRDGGIDSYEWLDDKADNAHYAIGNVFRTEKEAEFEVERLKVIVELKKYSREFVHGGDNWHVCYNFNHDYISYDYERVIKRTTLYFDSENIARQAVQAVGEDRVKKYYLGVE